MDIEIEEKTKFIDLNTVIAINPEENDFNPKPAYLKPFFKSISECAISGAKIYMAREAQLKQIETLRTHLRDHTTPKNLHVQISGLPKHLDMDQIKGETTTKILQQHLNAHVTKYNELNAKLPTLIPALFQKIASMLLITSGFTAENLNWLSTIHDENPLLETVIVEYNKTVIQFQEKLDKLTDQKAKKKAAFELKQEEKKNALIEKGKKAMSKTTTVPAVEDQVATLAAQVEALTVQTKKLQHQLKTEKQKQVKTRKKGKEKEKKPKKTENTEENSGQTKKERKRKPNISAPKR